ncbi:MAG TPA: hypothetical protein VHM88_08390 [Candidatus Acidoferrales bacterium]|nr:hypothetical protein [Candidatus Acidoferrales bacterium]
MTVEFDVEPREQEVTRFDHSASEDNQLRIWEVDDTRQRHADRGESAREDLLRSKVTRSRLLHYEFGVHG